MINKRPIRVSYPSLEIGAIQWGARARRLVQHRSFRSPFGIACRVRPDLRSMGGPYGYHSDKGHHYRPTWHLG